MALPLPLSGSFNLFSQTVVVYDDVSTLVDGRANIVTEPDREIIAGIQPAEDLKIKLDRSGALSTGTMLLYTADFVSGYDRTNTATINRQTYARYVGEVWKLSTLAFLADKSNYNWFFLTKYTSIRT